MKFITKASKQKYHDTTSVVLFPFAQNYYIQHTWEMPDIKGFLLR